MIFESIHWEKEKEELLTTGKKRFEDGGTVKMGKIDLENSGDTVTLRRKELL